MSDGQLPPLLHAGQQAPQMPQAGFAPQQQAQPTGMRGRPMNDPEMQIVKVERTQEIRRLEALLPKQAVDSKVQIFKLKDGEDRPSASAKPKITLLATDLEKGVQEGSDSESLIEERIKERYSEGRFFCKVVDRLGKMVGAFPPWMVDLNNEEDGDEEEDPEDEDLKGDPNGDPPPGPMMGGINPMTGQPWAYSGYPPPMPPPPPPQAMDARTFMDVARETRDESDKKTTDLMGIFAQMSQQSTTMLMAMQENARREDARREEREEKRRTERNQLLLSLLPTLLPIVKDFIQPKKTEGMSPELQLLISTLQSKDQTGGMKDMMSFMIEASKAQAGLQASAAQSAMATQAELSAMMTKNLVEQLKTTMELKAGGGERSEGGMMDTIGKLAGPLLASMAAAQQQQPPAPAFIPAQPAPAPEPVQPALAHTPQPAAPVVKAPAPPAKPQPAPTPAKPEPTDAARIGACLRTIQAMDVGKVPAAQRWDALRWCSDNMPESLRQAIRIDSEEQVMSLGMTAVVNDPALLAWISNTESVSFLRVALADIRRLLLGTLDAERASSAVKEQEAWVNRKAPAVEVPPAAPAVEVPTAPVAPAAEAPVSVVPVEEVTVVGPPAPPVDEGKVHEPEVAAPRGKRQPPKAK